MWNLIPQLFYDLLSRIVPGAIIILFLALVVYTPSTTAKFIFDTADNKNLFALGPLLLWILGSYLIGFILGQLWEVTIGRFTNKTELKIETKCKKECLAEHNRFQKALGHPDLKIKIRQLPRVFIMRNNLRPVAPSEASRLLKVRAERRLCQVLILGFLVLSILNITYPQAKLGNDRIILEILLIVTILSCWSRSWRLYQHYNNGTISSWLIYASSGQIPLQKTKDKSN